MRVGRTQIDTLLTCHPVRTAACHRHLERPHLRLRITLTTSLLPGESQLMRLRRNLPVILPRGQRLPSLMDALRTSVPCRTPKQALLGILTKVHWREEKKPMIIWLIMSQTSLRGSTPTTQRRGSMTNLKPNLTVHETSRDGKNLQVLRMCKNLLAPYCRGACFIICGRAERSSPG